MWFQLCIPMEILLEVGLCNAGVSSLSASLDHTGRRVVLGHLLNTQTLMKTDEPKKKWF